MSTYNDDRRSSRPRMSKAERERRRKKRILMHRIRAVSLWVLTAAVLGLIIYLIYFVLGLLFGFVDVRAPKVTLNGEETMIAEQGVPFDDPGVLALDEKDGDVSDKVIVEGELDTSVPGDYLLTYIAKDSHKNERKITRKVIVKDTKGPEITLNGEANMVHFLGEEFTDPGYTAIDLADGDVTAKVAVSGATDLSQAGEYTINYIVSDQAGNESQVQRIVRVIDGSKVVYLTFDDGPGQYTEQLLDVLDRYNVKATFFVTNQYSDYRALIAEEARRGHTVAVHTYCHDYNVIYSSTDAYWADFEKMAEIIREDTGNDPKIFRFPGGGSNTVSRKYCDGVMTALTQQAAEKGLHYFDWNVTSGDAGETTSTDVVVSNVIRGIKECKIPVVLQHDIKGFSVEAVDDIIEWGLENGYTFLPIDMATPENHHHVNN